MIRGVLAAVAGAFVGWFVRGSEPRERLVAPAPADPVRAERPPRDEPERVGPARPALEADRDTLVDACVWAYESSPSRAVQRRMADALDEVGVELLRPIGVPFDPAQHERVGVEEGAAPGAPVLVLRTLRPGVRDGGHLVRPAQVVVHAPGPGGPTITEVRHPNH